MQIVNDASPSDELAAELRRLATERPKAAREAHAAVTRAQSLVVLADGMPEELAAAVEMVATKAQGLEADATREKADYDARVAAVSMQWADTVEIPDALTARIAEAATVMADALVDLAAAVEKFRAADDAMHAFAEPLRGIDWDSPAHRRIFDRTGFTALNAAPILLDIIPDLDRSAGRQGDGAAAARALGIYDRLPPSGYNESVEAQ